MRERRLLVTVEERGAAEAIDSAVQEREELFDLWLGLTVLNADPEEILAGFNHYMRDATFSFPELRDNLAAKLATTGFRRDLDALTTDIPAEYDPDTAAHLVMRELGSRLRNAPPVEEIGPLLQG